jgi:hypothetical protein
MNDNDYILKEHTFTDPLNDQYFKVVIRKFKLKPECVYYEVQTLVGDQWEFKLYYSPNTIIKAFSRWQKAVLKVPDFVVRVLDISQPYPSVKAQKLSFYEWLSSD